MNTNDSTREDSERSKKHSRENIYHLREYLNHHEQTSRRNMDATGAYM
jgi:hypothetical protein